MTTEKPARLSYVILSRAWYGKANLEGRKDGNVPVTDQISLGRMYPDGGCDWEASIDFLRFDGGHTGVKFEVFEDGWQAFSECPQLFAALAQHATRPGAPSPDVDEIAAILQSAGFADATPTVDPYTAVKPAKRVRAHA